MRSKLQISAAAVAGVALAAGFANEAGASRPELSIIRLSCPEAAERILCQSMIRALAEAAPGKVIRRVERGEETPARTKDVGISFHMTMQADDHVSARLDLFQYGAMSPTQGPEVSLESPSTDPNALSREIVASSPRIISELK